MSNTTKDAAPNKSGVGGSIEHHMNLIRKVAQDRDWAAFQDLFVFFGPRVKAMMLKSGADSALADDLVQETMAKVWRKAELYAARRGSVSTWIFTIARNARIDRVRRGASQPYEDIEHVDLVSNDADAEAYVVLAQQSELVAQAVAELPDEQRRVIELAYMDDLAQSEIAERLKVPLGTVKSRMRLAYGKLKVKLEDCK